MESVSQDSSNENVNYAADFLKEATKNVDINFSPKGILPGDDVTDLVTGLKNVIKIGSGLEQIENKVICNIGGTLRYRPPATYWVETNRKRYFPHEGDQVIGVIEDKGGDFYKVNIFSGSASLLNRLAFDGATKRNKPELKVGDIVYAHISSHHKHLSLSLFLSLSYNSL
mmetsp:Transcript_22445/g.22633  ORF Transcript_22445/g.22633 Transcript_22445/m.22633 type:complete len:170 (+) Transcript_22445:51-560(+)